MFQHLRIPAINPSERHQKDGMNPESWIWCLFYTEHQNKVITWDLKRGNTFFNAPWKQKTRTACKVQGFLSDMLGFYFWRIFPHKKAFKRWHPSPVVQSDTSCLHKSSLRNTVKIWQIGSKKPTSPNLFWWFPQPMRVNGGGQLCCTRRSHCTYEMTSLHLTQACQFGLCNWAIHNYLIWRH